MESFVLKQLKSENIEKELQNIGFDEGYRFAASDKFRYKNIKIYNLTSAQANILKQTALTCGADCATNREVITGRAEHSDVILGGSEAELKKICDKLAKQPFKMGELGKDISNSLNRQTRKTKLVGILNVTPDSFSDGGLYTNPEDAQKHIIEMIDEGADMIDIGAESTKPYSQAVSPDEQIKRLKPILNFIKKENIEIPISIDTRCSEVADFAINNGANFINDVSGFDYDKKMITVLSKYSAGVIIQHSKGTPDVMQNSPIYNDVVEEIYLSLMNKIKLAHNAGIKDVVADPGIGFGKTRENNFEIIERAEEFFSLNVPVMFGISRKSMLGVQNNNNDLKDSLSAMISYPLAKAGVDYLRVHNISLHKKMLDLIEN